MWPFQVTFEAAFAPWSSLGISGHLLRRELRSLKCGSWASSTHIRRELTRNAGSLALSPPGWVSPDGTLPGPQPAWLDVPRWDPPWPSARLAGCSQMGPPALRAARPQRFSPCGSWDRPPPVRPLDPRAPVLTVCGSHLTGVRPRRSPGRVGVLSPGVSAELSPRGGAGSCSSPL